MSAYHEECPQCGASPHLLAENKRLRELSIRLLETYRSGHYDETLADQLRAALEGK